MDELLATLARLSECQYLSDLHIPRNAARVARAIRAIPVERYTLEEWLAAAQYITGRDHTAADAAQAVSQILAALI